MGTLGVEVSIMTLSRYGPEHEWESVENQARHFWNSPWAMVSQWRPGQTRDVYVYENDDDIIIDVDLAGISPQDALVEMDDTHVNLEVRPDPKGRWGGDEIVIPLPFHVNPDTARANWHHGLLEIQVQRQLTKSRSFKPTIRQ